MRDTWKWEHVCEDILKRKTCSDLLLLLTHSSIVSSASVQGKQWGSKDKSNMAGRGSDEFDEFVLYNCLYWGQQ